MSGPTTTEHASPVADGSRPARLPRLLAGVDGDGAVSLRRHLAVHGPLPSVARRSRRRGGSELIDEVEAARLLGRGGAAFPAAAKMRAVAARRGRVTVVANGAEGEPASGKDRALLELVPHLILDGAALAAAALGAEEAVVAVCELGPDGFAAVTEAVREREAAGGERVAGGTPKLRVAAVPGHYVAGQESALINYLGGGPALPTFTPPLPFERGLGRGPTLVSNVETLAHVALIARNGAAWFRELGTAAQPGSALVTLSGPVAYPGVYEVELGSSLSSLIEAAGGATGTARGVLLGGYAGTWIGGEYLRGVALSDEHLAVHGASFGTGVVALLSADACPVAETVRLADWLAGQSSRQCGPCVNGLDAIAGTLEELCSGAGGGTSAQRIEQLASLTVRRGACGHPDGAVRMILSALEAFASEFADHARHGPCEACARGPELPLPARELITEPARRRSGRR
jgi:NADH:ubiquinone oxidoreductase subunit F (NADH-binding)